jgi:hypothetical protein
MGKHRDADEQVFLNNLTWLMNTIGNGRTPTDVASILTSTQAVALPKKNNGLRPLGLRDGFVNMTTKCILKHLQEETIKIFDDINYALAGPKKMDELIALITHAVRVKPEHDRLFIDCTNAFNQIDRLEASNAIQATCPRLSRYFHFLYNRNTTVWARSDEDTWDAITGAQGGTQGCVLAPIVFGFGSLSTYRGIDDFLKLKDNALFGAYLDDCVISAAHSDTIESFNIFQNDGPQHGMEINYGINKTVVLLGKCVDEADKQQRIAAYREAGLPLDNIKIHPDNGGPPEDYGYIHLGVPQGSTTFQFTHLHDLVNKFITAGNCDEIVEEAQEKWVYLLWVTRQKFPFWFRHMCPSITSTVDMRIETHIRRKFDTVLGQATTDREWAQACLPTKTHGCGLGRTADIISSAFAANVEETMVAVKRKLPATQIYLNLFHSNPDAVNAHVFESEGIRQFVTLAREKKQVVIDAANDLLELPVLTAYDSDNTSRKMKTQHLYSDFINRSRALEMEILTSDRGSGEMQARFLSNNGSFAGAWLFNIPKDKHSTMSSSQFRTALKLRLGASFNTLPMLHIVAAHREH